MKVSYTYDLVGVLDLVALAALADGRETARHASAPRLAFATLRGFAGI
jgi:hypothetical protein